LVKTGYGREDLLVALKGEHERELEERAFEWGRDVTRGERVLRWCAGSGIALMVAGLAMPGSGRISAGVTSIGALIGIPGAVGSLVRYSRRTNLIGRALAGLMQSRVGQWCFRLAKATVRGAPGLPQATHRPTELAIGMAVDTLFEALPKTTRRDLADLPKIVRGLEADAMRMRRKVAELTEAVARLDSGGDSAKLATRRESIDRDLRQALDASRERLSESVTALEGIRLNLLRLSAGVGSVGGLTADLAAAREIGAQVERLLEGQREVDVLIRGAEA
jgi:hypothetical protein